MIRALNISRYKGWFNWLFVHILLFAGTAINAQFTIDPGGYVTIKEGSTLHIGTDLNLNSTAAGSGYLADQTVDGDVNVTGTINIKRYMTADYWHNSSSPIANANSSVFGSTDLVFYYDESLIINDWMFGWVMYSGALSVMRGYDVYLEDNPVTVNYSTTGINNLNTANYSIGVSLTWFDNGDINSHRGWNLLGNPYASPIDWLATSGWDKTDINDAKYIWNGTNDNYTIYLGGSTPIGINGGTRFIPSNQGFWVQAIQNGTVTVNNSTRTGDISGTPDFYKSTQSDYPMIDLVAHANGLTDESIIRFIPGTTELFDVNFDASKLFSQGNEVPQIFSITPKDYLAINTLPEMIDDLEVNLGFKCNSPGLCSIELNERSQLGAFDQIYLRDVLEKKMINLSDQLSYHFYHQPYNNPNRFRVYVNPTKETILQMDPDDYFTVYYQYGQLVIIRNTETNIEAQIIIYNTLGQPVYQNLLSPDLTLTLNLNLATGYYYVSIITQGHTTNYKVFCP